MANCKSSSAPMRRLQGALILLGFAFGLGLAAAPVPKGKDDDKLGEHGKIVEDWSLTLSTSSEKMSENFRAPTSATLTLRNHAKRPRTIQEVRSLESNLRFAEGLSYVLRFQNGVVLEVPNRTFGLRNMIGTPPAHQPVRIPAGGKVVAAHPDLTSMLHLDRREVREAYRKCKVFAVTVIATECDLNLASNTVFVNGTFDLPKKHDPIADAKAYRAAKKKAKAKGR